MNKHILLKFIGLAILILISIEIYPKSKSKNTTNYYATDSVAYYNESVLDKGKRNFQYCTILGDKGDIKYSPDVVIKYGLSNGRLFYSKSIKEDSVQKNVFVEQLVSGETSLYYYESKNEKIFFIEKKDSTSSERKEYLIKKSGLFKEEIKEITSDCREIQGNLKYALPNKASMKKVLKGYNDCKSIYLPHFRYGILLGGELNHISPTISDETIKYFSSSSSHISFIPGLFIDAPIAGSNISIHAEIYHAILRMSFNKKISSLDYDLTLNTNSIKIPLLMRYTFLQKKLCPFINAGGIINYNYKNDHFYNSANHKDDNTIEINSLYDDKKVMDNLLWGYSAGIGLEYKLSLKNALFIELRYNKLYNTGLLNSSEFNLITAINFER